MKRRGGVCPLIVIATVVYLLYTMTGGFASAAVVEISPGTDKFKGAVENQISCGDTLILHAGAYIETQRNSIQHQCTAASPIVIKGADGEARPLLTRSGSAQNVVNLEGNASYITIQGLEITNPTGADGIRANGNHTELTFTDLVIHDIDIGISPQTNVNGLTITNNHIYNTGAANGTGEGMYIGCHNGNCAVENGLIANNWIHDSLPGTTQGDGIEVKYNSHSVTIRDNVVYNRSYPCIIVYGNDSSTLRNIIERNVVWNCGVDGIYAVSDATVRNNVVFDSDTGLSLYGHSAVPVMEQVTAVNNTLYKNKNGVYVRWSSGIPSLVLANNAIYSPGQTAINSGFGIPNTVFNNYVEGALPSDSIDNSRFFNGGSAANQFVDPTNKNVWLKSSSILIDAAHATFIPMDDFNTRGRGTTPFDVGAYETKGATTNPGWQIKAGFKPEVSSGGPGSTLGNLAVQMSPGAWAKLSTTGLTADFLADPNTAGDHSILEYSDKAVWDPLNRMFIFAGGGHLGQGRIIAYKESTNTWSYLTANTSCTRAHNYGNTTINPLTGLVYKHVTASPPNCTFQASSNSWGTISALSIPSFNNMSESSALEYFPERNSLFWIDSQYSANNFGRIAEFPLPSGPWTLIVEQLAGIGTDHTVAHYSPVHKVLVIGGGNNSKTLYRINAAGTRTKITTPVQICVWHCSVFTLDPVSGDFLVLTSSKAFYSFQPLTNTWTQLTGSHTPPNFWNTQGQEPATARIVAAPINTYGVTMFVSYNDSNPKVYLYKHLPSIPTNPDTVPPANPTNLHVVDVQ